MYQVYHVEANRTADYGSPTEAQLAAEGIATANPGDTVQLLDSSGRCLRIYVYHVGRGMSIS